MAGRGQLCLICFAELLLFFLAESVFCFCWCVSRGGGEVGASV